VGVSSIEQGKKRKTRRSSVYEKGAFAKEKRSWFLPRKVIYIGEKGVCSGRGVSSLSTGGGTETFLNQIGGKRGIGFARCQEGRFVEKTPQFRRGGVYGRESNGAAYSAKGDTVHRCVRSSLTYLGGGHGHCCEKRSARDERLPSSFKGVGGIESGEGEKDVAPRREGGGGVYLYRREHEGEYTSRGKEEEALMSKRGTGGDCWKKEERHPPLYRREGRRSLGAERGMRKGRV